MFRKLSRNEEKGFTLIELLIVMALLGVLVAVLLPKYQDLTPEAKIASTQANLETIRSAVLLHAAKYQTLPATVDTLAPEFLRKVPVLKISGSTTVIVGTMPSSPAAGGNWYYDPVSGEVKVGINAVGGSAPKMDDFIGSYSGTANPWEW
jgi:prepilin-type N-terminal cleavage/methylation domain-containing protein